MASQVKRLIVVRNQNDPPPSCTSCKKPLNFELWRASGKDYCERCAVAKGWGIWWDIYMRYPTFKTPRVNPKGRFALRGGNSWVAACHNEPCGQVTMVPLAKDARLFCGDWLNTTNWQWSDNLKPVPAKEVSQIAAKEKKVKK